MRLLILVLSAALAVLPLQAASRALVPAGEYTPAIRGVQEPEKEPVAAFEMDTRPVTNADFLAFLRAHPEWQRSRVSRLYADSGYLRHWSSDLNPGPSAPLKAPVVNVSWFAARAFARWSGSRLPTTAEWERVARVGFTSEDAEREPAVLALLNQWISRTSEGNLPDADAGEPNRLGLRNLHGLVWEWVEDFDATLDPPESRSTSSAETNLFCGATALTARDKSAYFAFLRAGFRSSLRAAYTLPSLGFRCARTL